MPREKVGKPVGYLGQSSQKPQSRRADLVDLLEIPSVSLILGKRGSGKTAFGYKVLEEARNHGLTPYVMGLPKNKWHLLPNYIEPIENPAEIGDDSAILMDESYQYMFAREHSTSFNKFLAKLLGIVRQKNQLFMFATHLARKLDVSAVYDSDNIVFREPSFLHARMERREIRDLIKDASKFFGEVADTLKSAYVITPKGAQGVDVDLPSFWSEELSRAFADIELLEKRVEEKAINEKEREVLGNILQLEESGDYDLGWGWEMHEVEGLNGGLIAKFLSEGLIERGLTTGSTKCFYGNIEKIKERLGR